MHHVVHRHALGVGVGVEDHGVARSDRGVGALVRLDHEAETLERCLQSIFGQTHTDRELVVIDGRYHVAGVAEGGAAETAGLLEGDEIRIEDLPPFPDVEEGEDGALVGRIGVAVSPANPDRVWALVTATGDAGTRSAERRWPSEHSTGNSIVTVARIDADSGPFSTSSIAIIAPRSQRMSPIVCGYFACKAASRWPKRTPMSSARSTSPSSRMTSMTASAAGLRRLSSVGFMSGPWS